MKHFKIIALAVLTTFATKLSAQESDTGYIEFNDRKNTVHGVYMGLGFHYGKLKRADTYGASYKVAYVANQQFEVGFVATGFYADMNRLGLEYNDQDLAGVYGGLHIEPILFSKSKINLSFPLLIGGGAIGLVENSIHHTQDWEDDWQPIFVIEPGINILYNISRYIQFETGLKYRVSSRINLEPDYSLKRINGFTAGLGIKVGVFNMGRNRYKKNLNGNQ